MKTPLFLFLVCQTVFADMPVQPSDVLSKTQIDEIHNAKNYFFHHIDLGFSPIWKVTNRNYGRHFLGQRNKYFSLKDLVYRVANDSFPIQLRMEELYRGKMGIHSKVGAILPRFDVKMDNGNFLRSFSGLLNFLSPSNWMKIKNQHRVYKITKHVMVKEVLDEVLFTKLLYYDLHQKITEFEIINFYFLHLQLLAEKFNEESRGLLTLMAEFALEGINMAIKMGDIKLRFVDLGLLTALEEIDGDYTLDKLNIKSPKDFPRVVKELKDLPENYQDKDKFLRQVVKRSVELKAVKELSKIANLGIGIYAAGGIIGNIKGETNPSEFEYIMSLGYGYLPNILFAKSTSRTAKINVRKEYVDMLSKARRSFDMYTNSLTIFTEGKRSIENARHAFNVNIHYLLLNDIPPDALFFINLRQLINSELKLNQALHNSLIARALMDRYLLIDDLGVVEMLPGRKNISRLFDGLERRYKQKSKKQKELDTILQKAKKKKHLQRIFYERHLYKYLSKFSTKEIVAGIKVNLDYLLHSNWIYPKKKRFFSLLYTYIQEQKIRLTSTQKAKLFKKLGMKRGQQNFGEHTFEPLSKSSGFSLNSS